MTTDGWLERHADTYPAGARVLELGCGDGVDAAWLAARGHLVTACDLDPDVLRSAVRTIGTERLLRVDTREMLPFRNDSFDAVVASLTLHYFTWETTLRAFAEIHRVLADLGVLAFRVNASDDLEFGALDGEEVEPGLRRYAASGTGYGEGQMKRFFDEPMVRNCLDGFAIESLEHRVVARWAKPKQVWECRARRLT